MRGATQIIALSFLASCAWVPGSNQVSDNEIGRVVNTAGQPRILRGDRYLEVGKKTAVEVKDIVITGLLEKAEIKMSDGTLITLGPESQFVFHVYSFRDPAPIARMSFNSGSFRLKAGKLTGKEDARFEVITPLAVISVDSGEVWVGYLDEQAAGLTITLMSGGQVTVGNQFGEVQLSKKDEATSVTFHGSPSNPVKRTDEQIRNVIRATSL